MDPTQDETESEQYGVQWRTIGGGLGVFSVSVLLTYALGDAAPASGSRATAALTSAAFIFAGTIVSFRVLRHFLSHETLSSPKTFLVVWVLAFAVWMIVRHS
jgi:hypothetical protein